MGAINIKINSASKYVLLYGESGVGKTLLQYCMQSNFNDFDQIEQTKGVNYEEIEVKGINMGIFDCPGDIMQYEMCDIIGKCVSVEGIVFVVSLERIYELDKARDRLKMIVNNKHIKKGISLLVIYNFKSNMADKFWMGESLLDYRMKLDKYKEKYNLRFVKSIMCDVNMNNLKDSKLYSVFEDFVQSMDK
jgi:hypothetical protein